jgi:histidinol-phosphate aminotransferase
MATFSRLANPWVNGLAIYEPGRPIEEVARELGFRSADEVIKLASNENAIGPSPLAMEAMRRCASQMHRYPDGDAFYLKRALAKNLSVKPDEILPTNGSNEAIELLAHVFLGPGTSIVTGSHAFVVYRLMAAMFRAETITVPMKNFAYDMDATLAAIRPDTRIVFVGNPNNPTSTMVDGGAIDAFMARVPEQTVVCFDEAYIELLPPERQPDTLKFVREGRNAVVLRTFSKTYGLAGLRIGYAVAPRECVQLLNRVRQPFNVNGMALAAAEAALGDDAHVAKSRKFLAEGLAYFEKELRRMKLPYVPAVANFMLVEVGEGRKVFDQMQRKGVIVRPMDGYGLGRYVRVTVGTAEENRKCIAALGEVLGLSKA